MGNKTINMDKDDKEKETDGHGVYSLSIIYTLVNEALNHHKNLYYQSLYDSVYALWGILDNKNSTRYISIKNRLDHMLYEGVDVRTISGKVVKISSLKILIAGCSASSQNCVYCELLRDIDGNIVTLSSDDLVVIYNFVGKVLYMSLFEILQDKNIVLPECLYNMDIKEE